MPELAEAHYQADTNIPVLHDEAVTRNYDQLLQEVFEESRESEYWRLFHLFTQARNQLHELALLGPNWDSYGAEPPNERARNAAETVLALLKATSLPPTRVVPSSEGGVGICFVDEDRYADFECFNDGEILAVRYRGTEEPIVWEVTLGEEPIKAAIEQIRAHFTA